MDDITTDIRYDRMTGDFACYASVDGAEEYIGSRGNHTDASTLCREWRFHYYADHFTPEKAAQVAMEQEPPAMYGQPGAIDRLADRLVGMAEEHKRLIAAGKYEEAHALNIDGRKLCWAKGPGVLAVSLAPTAGRELAFCSICNRPFTTTNHDEDYICPDCLASTASTGAPETATAALTAAP